LKPSEASADTLACSNPQQWSSHMSRAKKKPTPRKREAEAPAPDPIFAAIEAHESACAAVMAYVDRGEDIPPTVSHHKEMRALARTSPHTPEGVRALGAHIAKWWSEFFNDVADPRIKTVFQSLSKAGGVNAVKDNPAFNTAHKRWLKAQAGWIAASWNTDRMSEAAYDRLVDKRHTARREATERLAAIRSQDPAQLSSKTEALWSMLLCDFKSEAEAIRFGDFGAEEYCLLKSIRRDAARLAKRPRA
jgi:hypothetical protein